MKNYNKAHYFQLEASDNVEQGVNSSSSISSGSFAVKYATNKGCVTKYLVVMLCISALISILLILSGNPLTGDLQGGVLTKTIPYKQVVHPEPITTLWGSVSKPYPTGAFWTNLAVNNGDFPVSVGIYDIKTVSDGVQVSYGATRRFVTKISITDAFDVDLQISSQEQYMSRSILRYDNLSVTMQYQTISNGKYIAHLVKGSPFVTVEFQGVTPIITAPNMHIANCVQQMTSVAGSDGQQYVITLGNYQQWLLYSSSNVPLTWTADSIVASGPVNGVIRLAILPLQNSVSVVAALQPYVGCYPIRGSVTFTYSTQQQATITYQFTTVGKGALLMLAMPHHIASMTFPSIPSDINSIQNIYLPIFSMKGQVVATVGTIWKMTLNLVQVGWNYNLMDPLSNDQLDEIAYNLMTDVQTVTPNAVDVYSFAKQMGRMAQLALIADNLGISDSRQDALSAIELAILPWFQNTQSDSFVYDKSYGGIVTSVGITDKSVDFGSGWYNDHHFHYGYLVFAAAVITRFDNPFYMANGAYFDSLVKDICNPDPSDPNFPFARHKDLFDGHSWATGILSQANGKSQESSSEAINAYYGCYLYGLATANVALTQFSQVLLTLEIQAAQMYWHMPDNRVYDEYFTSNKMIGNVGGSDVTASTWFGSLPEYVHGINMMPVTPVTSFLFDQNFVMKEWPILQRRLSENNKAMLNISALCSAHSDCSAMQGSCCPTPEGVMLGCCDAPVIDDEWLSYIYNIHAVIDRQSAWAEIQTLHGFGCGGSMTNSLFWTASRAPTLVGYNSSQYMPTFQVQAACSLNSACEASGLTGQCCPTPGPNGQFLGCCPAP